MSLVKDSKIEFCLASRDPNNEPTDGIDRHDGSDLSYTNFFSGQTSTAYYAERGITNGSQYDIPLQGIPDAILKDWFHWPVDKYFNFYIVSEINGNDGGGGVQGFSYVGSLGTGANGESYGPVCLYNVTGTVGNLKVGRELNTTWAHEVGHALNLYHTFGVGGFGGSCDPESNPCSSGDQCPDTPPTGTNTGCSPAFAVCPDAQLENYMDYTGESCKTAFTQNQIERMREEIWTGLDYLVNTNNVSCQSPNSKDVAVTAVSVPGEWCLDEIDFYVKLNNFGGEPAEGVVLAVNDQIVEVTTIPSGEFTLVYFYDFELGDGLIEVEAIYSLDEFLDNNTATVQIEVVEQNWLEVVISPDVWSNEINWTVTDEQGELVLEGGDYPVFSQDTDFSESTCLPEGCYTFRITDSAGDGMCAFDFDDDGVCDGTYDAFINISINDNTIFNLSDPSELDYGDLLEYEFCTYVCPEVSCPSDLDGDGATTFQDLALFLSYYGQTIDDCSPYDLNNDLEIDVDDLTLLLGVYGTTCFDQMNQSETGQIAADATNVTEIENTLIAGGRCIVGDPLYFDLTGRQVMVGDLSQGIYIIVENWDDGSVTTRKVFIGGF